MAGKFFQASWRTCRCSSGDFSCHTSVSAGKSMMGFFYIKIDLLCKVQLSLMMYTNTFRQRLIAFLVNLNLKMEF